ncbi:hypothetical protein CN378_12170 [Bacillus sp. AFS015802]|uniref:CBO0543 family protein n=1 Tax=Bacillus sp. AFS015802 TaxID=2033486 RepID=UPI000BFA620E|nr:CBO0543 family protein [Bacillus sp. AFS015802]PFA67124.1 hypothetical protein CN378_12170 [Bacillus sp. AFS015802]
MSETQNAILTRLKDIQKDQTDTWIDYWLKFSDLGSWQFWIMSALFILPLIFLYIFLDKKKAVFFGFYGYNVHVFFTYADAIGANMLKWFYPYKLYPLLASSVSLDVSLVPVSYMLMYQWCYHNKKNYYVFMLILCAVFAFVFKPLLLAAGLFQMNNGTSYIHLFMIYVAVGLIAKWITNLFGYFETKNKKSAQ